MTADPTATRMPGMPQNQTADQQAALDQQVAGQQQELQVVTTAPVVRPVARPLQGGWLHIVVAAVGAIALALGLGGAAMSFCGLASTVEPVAVAVPMVVAAAVAAVSVWLGGRGRTTLIAYAAMLVAAVVVGVVASGPVMAGMGQILNGITDVVGSRTGVYGLLFATGTSGDLALALSILAVPLGMACALMARQGGLVLSLVLSFVLLILLITGLVQPGLWIVLFALGVVVCLLCNTMLLDHVAHARTLAAVAVACAVVIAVVSGVCAAASGAMDTSGARQAVMQTWYGLLYGGDSWSMPEGKLSNLGALQDNERPALMLLGSGTTDAEDIDEYLRGYVGEVYDGQGWTTLPSSVVDDNRALFYWLEQDGFDQSSQIASTASLVGYKSGTSVVVPVTASDEAGEQADVAPSSNLVANYQGARAGYAYLPYAYAGGAEATAITDLATVKRDGAQQSDAYAVDTSLLRQSYLVQARVQSMQSSATDDVRTQLDCEGAYREFVYDNYLGIPEQTAQVFEQLLGESVQLTSEQAKIQVLDALDHLVVYDADAGDPGTDDFVEGFLTTTQKGYSVHYATAATLLMRYYGVPARYVEGYRLDVAAEHGTVGEDGSVQLTENDAHAWTEYYLDGVGWVPFDVTPGWRERGYYMVADQTAVMPNADPSSNGTNSSSTAWKPQEQPQDQQVHSVPPVVAELSYGLNWLWALLGFALVVLVALFIRSMMRRQHVKEFLTYHCDARSDPNTSVPMLFSYAMMLARECRGFQPEQGKPFVRQAREARAAGVSSVYTFASASAANARARFSPQGATERDRTAVIAMIHEQVEALRHQTRWKRFVQCWWKCLWR